MFKKVVVTGLAIVAVLFVLHKLELDIWIKHWVKQTKTDIKNSIPEEARLDDLRDEIAKIGPEIKKARIVVAREIGDVKELRDEIEKIKGNLAKREETLRELDAKLDATPKATKVSIGKKEFDREDVEADLNRQWVSFKQSKEMLQAKEDLLKSREENLNVAKAELQAMQDKEAELTADADALSLRLRKLRLAQTQENVQVKSNHLTAAMQKRDELKKQVGQGEVELTLKKGTDTGSTVADALEQKAKADQVRKEMKDYLNKDSKLTKTDK